MKTKNNICPVCQSGFLYVMDIIPNKQPFYNKPQLQEVIITCTECGKEWTLKNTDKKNEIYR